MKISYILPITQDTGSRLTDTSCALKYLNETIDSILRQSVPNWELIVVIDSSLKVKVAQIYSKLVQNNRAIDNIRHIKNKDTNIHLVSIRTKNSAIACNKGLEIAKGQYIATIQAGDKLAEFTTYELIKCLVENPKTKYIYSDHDHIDLKGRRFKPFFKPDLSPDLLYCQNYINNLVLIKKCLLRKIGNWNKNYDAAYDYELNLRAISSLIKLDRPNPKLLGNLSPIKHISQIMYHQRVNLKINPMSKAITNLKPKKADGDRQSRQSLAILKEFFKKEQRNVTITQIKPKLYRHHWVVSKPEPLVSLIIPTRDGYDILKTCVESILEKTTYTNYEILIVDNQSKDKKTVEYMHDLTSKHENIRILEYNKAFNYSAINNFAANKAKGSILGLINNDTEVITPEWLTEMVSHAIRPEIGCVGAMLHYPDGTIQHAGVVIENGTANHAFKGLKNIQKDDYFNYLNSIRNPQAVTAAILLIKRSLFFKLNGFDEVNFKIAFNDVVLCIRAESSGCKSIWLPTSKLIHHESKTRLIPTGGDKEVDNLRAYLKKYDHQT